MKCTLRTASAKRICSPEYQHKSTNDRKPVEQVGRKTLQRTIFIFHFTTTEQMQRSCRVSPSSLTFFSRSRPAKPARTVAARSGGPRQSSSSPSCLAAVTPARRVRTTQTRMTTRTLSWWWKKWLHSRRCVESSLWGVYYHVAGEIFHHH